MTETATYRALRRSRSDRMLSGVCGGLGRYFDVNPTFYRVGFVLLALLGGAGILIYGVALLVMPDEGQNESIIEEALREHRDYPFRLAGIAIAVVAGLVLLSHARIWPHGDAAWVLLLLAGIALIASRRGRRRETLVSTGIDGGDAVSGGAAAAPRARRRSFPVTLAALGLLVIETGIFAALAGSGIDTPWAIAIAIEAGTVGAVLIGAAFMQLRVAGLVVIGLMLGIAAIAASTIDVRLGDGIGKRSFTPATAAALNDHYRLGIGDLELDLSHTPFPAGKTTVDARLGIGLLRIVVPRAATVRVESHVRWGDSHVLGHDENGTGVDDTVVRIVKGSTSTLVLDTHVEAGKIEVERAA